MGESTCLLRSFSTPAEASSVAQEVCFSSQNLNFHTLRSAFLIPINFFCGSVWLLLCLVLVVEETRTERDERLECLQQCNCLWFRLFLFFFLFLGPLECSFWFLSNYNGPSATLVNNSVKALM